MSMLGDDGEIYYAQLRSFLVDQFGQLSATISWLIPSERSPPDGSFDAASFIIGLFKYSISHEMFAVSIKYAHTHIHSYIYIYIS